MRMLCAGEVRLSRSGYGAAVLIAALLSGGCAPWGKPPANGPEAEVVGDFKTIYEENCSGCHGVNGVKGPGRPLNNALYVSLIPRATLRDVIENGRPGTVMPPWGKAGGGPLTEKQIEILVDGIETNWAKPVNASAMPSYAAANGDTGDAGHGKKLFQKDCFACHFKGGPVGPVTDASYLSLVSNQMLRTAIIVGRQDLGGLVMPDYRSLNAGHALSGQDVSDLLAYLGSQRPVAVEEDAHTIENGTGLGGEMAKGNEGSGHGPGSPRQQQGEGNKARGSSQGGGIK